MSTAKKEYKRITTKTLVDMKKKGEKISMLTAYDFTMAKIVDSAGIDVILVGDSASNVMAGHETTLPITLDQMIYHAASVVRAIERSLVVVDLPFGSYQSDPKEALRSAIRIMKESGGHAYTVRAKEEEEAEKLISDALLLEKAGCFAVVLEKVPAKLAKEVAERISIPVIGIGAGNGVDGQVLVTHDMLGMTHEFNPRFLRRYLDLYTEMKNAFSQYSADVKSGNFPNDSEQY